MSVPSSSTRPPDGGTSPITVRNVVDLPTPLRPNTAQMRPRGTARSTPCSTWLAPKWVLRPSIRSINLSHPDRRSAPLDPHAPRPEHHLQSPHRDAAR